MTNKLLVVAAAALLAGPTVAHAQEANWIHVHVDEADGARVRVNVPLSLVDVAVEVAGEEGLEEEYLRWDAHGEVSLDDVRRMWRELRDDGDAEFVDVRDGDEHVRVFRRGNRVFVHIDEGDTEKVRVEMPSEVVDALLDSEGERLNLEAAVRQLARSGNQEFVRIRDRETTVRVWVDDSHTSGS